MTKEWGKIEINQKIAKIVDVILLSIHIFLLVFFAIFHIHIMVAANVFSISIYLAMLHFYRNQLEKFVLITYYEILLHMILAVVCVGWEFGFQFYSFALIPVIFYYDFLQRRKKGRRYYPVITSMLVVVAFAILRAYTWYYGALYNVSNPDVKLFCNLMNALFIFVFLVLYMANYETLTIHTDKMASKDELTGLDNRYRMDEIMKMILEEQSRQEIAVAIMDIDDFKKVNDTYGHNVGDVVLKAVARTIKDVQNDRTFVCRWGGEEFLVITHGQNCYQELQEQLQKLVQSVAKKNITCREETVSVTITAGASRKIEEETIDQAISRADKYLYQGKVSGKNRLVAED